LRANFSLKGTTRLSPLVRSTQRIRKWYPPSIDGFLLLLPADFRVAELLALAFLDILDLFHMSVPQYGGYSIGLSQLVLGDIQKCSLGAVLNTLRVPTAEVALERSGDVVVYEQCSEGTTDYTLSAGYALRFVYAYDAVLDGYGIGGAVLPTLGFGALPTHHRHANDGVGVESDHADGRLLRVVDPEVVQRTDHFAQPTPRASFGHHGQSLGHFQLLSKQNVGSRARRNRSRMYFYPLPVTPLPLLGPLSCW